MLGQLTLRRFVKLGNNTIAAPLLLITALQSWHAYQSLLVKAEHLFVRSHIDFGLPYFLRWHVVLLKDFILFVKEAYQNCKEVLIGIFSHNVLSKAANWLPECLVIAISV